MTCDVRGQSVIVTGASRGIGRATALAFAAAGARVAVNYRRERERADDTVARCRELGADAIAIASDVADEAEVKRLFDEATEALGPIDILVANAGVWEATPIARTSLPDWQRQLDANLTSVFLSCREAARLMVPRQRGAIVVVSSTAGQRGEAGYSCYAATKGGLISFVKSLASELGADGVRVNAVAPGWVATDMTRSTLDRSRETILAGIPLGRIAEPDDIAGPILFLASAAARHITGEILNVNGGSVLAG